MAFVEMKLTGVDGVLRTLQDLPAEVVSKRGGPVKAALRKGALVILKAEKTALQSTLGGADPDEQGSTGLLLKNLIASRGKAPAGGKGERYLVRVKRKTYMRKGGKPVTTLKTAQIKEYGSSKQAAEPWIRPSFAAKAGEAITTIERELVAGIDRIVKKLANHNRGR